MKLGDKTGVVLWGYTHLMEDGTPFWKILQGSF